MTLNNLPCSFWPLVYRLCDDLFGSLDRLLNWVFHLILGLHFSVFRAGVPCQGTLLTAVQGRPVHSEERKNSTVVKPTEFPSVTCASVSQENLVRSEVA